MFYKNLQTKVLTLLEKRGIRFDVISYDVSNNETIKGSPLGIRGPVNIDNVETSIVEEAEATIIATSEVDIDKDDYIRFDNTLYKIIDFTKTRPTNVTIVYEIFVKR